MKKKNYSKKPPKNNASDLTKKIETSLETLVQSTEQAKINISPYLKTMSKFYHYSFGNQMLIAMQFPGATKVAGYVTWKTKFHRQVKTGEAGIAILQPCIYSTEDSQGNETTKVYFKVGYVFDVSQTEGDPLPELPEWVSPEQSILLEQKLIEFCNQQGITVERKDLPGNIQGVSKGKKIILATDAGTKTLVHELAHEMLNHHYAGLDHATEEAEAEAIAYVVAEHFGLVDLHSDNYIALSAENPAEQIKSSLDTIARTAKKIIEAVEGKPEKEE